MTLGSAVCLGGLVAQAHLTSNPLVASLKTGGWMMPILLLVSFLGTLLFLERAFDLYLLQKLPTRAFMARIIDHVNHRRIQEALDACNLTSKHPLVATIKAGLVRTHRREREIERAMESARLAALPKLQKRVDLLGMLGKIAILLGLVGTISTLLDTFALLPTVPPDARQMTLATGISGAFYPLGFGLCVATVFMLFHHLIARRAQRILMEVEGGASSLLVTLAALVGQGQEVEASEEVGATSP